jgi:hypothetical protein
LPILFSCWQKINPDYSITWTIYESKSDGHPKMKMIHFDPLKHHGFVPAIQPDWLIGYACEPPKFFALSSWLI